MSDPRGHDDGDITVGSSSTRADALDFEFKAFLDSLGNESGYGPDDLIAGCQRAVAYIRACQSRGKK